MTLTLIFKINGHLMLFRAFSPPNRQNFCNFSGKSCIGSWRSICMNNYTDSRWAWPWFARPKVIFRLFSGILTPKSTKCWQCRWKSRAESWQKHLHEQLHWQLVILTSIFKVNRRLMLFRAFSPPKSPKFLQFQRQELHRVLTKHLHEQLH